MVRLEMKSGAHVGQTQSAAANGLPDVGEEQTGQASPAAQSLGHRREAPPWSGGVPVRCHPACWTVSSLSAYSLSFLSPLFRPFRLRHAQ